MIQAQLEDGRILEFPDGTDPQVIQSVVKRTIGAQQSLTELSPDAQKLPLDQQQELLDARRQQQEVGGLIQPGQETITPGGVQRAQAMEQLRQENPSLAQAIEETSGPERLAVGFQQGLRSVGRGAGKLVGGDFFPEVNDPALQKLQEVSTAAQTGKVAGEAAPFVAAAPLTGTVGTGVQLTRGGATLVPQVTSTAGRTAATSALGGAEGGTIAAGQDGTAGEVAGAALLGGTIGAIAEGAPSALRGRSQQLPRQLVEEGEELLKIRPSSSEVQGALNQSAPTIDKLFDASGKLFNSAKESGVALKPNFYRGFVRKLRGSLEDKGLDAVNTPQASRALERLEEMVGDSPDFNQLDQARKTAQVAADSQDKTTSALGNKIIDEIDGVFNSLNEQLLTSGSSEAVRQVKTARQLWGRARKSEMIERALEKAKGQGSGFENGIRVRFRQILDSDKKRKFFNKDEIKAMERVVQGSKGANLFKFLGRFGLSENQATSMLGATIGAGGGATLGSAAGGTVGAGVGAVLVPVIGQVSKGLAQKLTKNNANLANRVIRAGSDGEKIAKAYLSVTPKADRSAEELSQLLMRPDINIDAVSGEIAVEAAEIARRQRQQQAVATGAALTTVPVAAEEE